MTNLAENQKKNDSMEPDKNRKGEKKKGFVDGLTDKLIDKAEDFIDETAEKIHKSETYRKAGKSMEKATLDIRPRSTGSIGDRPGPPLGPPPDETNWVKMRQHETARPNDFGCLSMVVGLGVKLGS